jgi:hypothetical protein
MTLPLKRSLPPEFSRKSAQYRKYGKKYLIEKIATLHSMTEELSHKTPCSQ